MFNRRDDQRIVIDEAAGFLVAMMVPRQSLLYLGLGFAVFRVMDIVKPMGIKKLQSLPGGLGVVADDVAAGVLTNIILRIVMRLV